MTKVYIPLSQNKIIFTVEQKILYDSKAAVATVFLWAVRSQLTSL